MIRNMIRNDTAVIPAAVGQPVTDMVRGPELPATVLAVHSAAVILACDAGPVASVVTVTTAQASGVPNGVRTALHAADRPFGRIAPGGTATVGRGGVLLPGLRLRAVRVVRTAVPRVRPTPQAVTVIAGAARSSARGVPERPVRDLSEALSGAAAGIDGAHRALQEAVTALVGLGSGSTPGGDDVLCGVLAALHAGGGTELAGRIAAAALPGLAERTPLVSADLLRLAVLGHACEEASAVLRACAAGPDAALRRALAQLLAIGHTSGADLATGLALGLGIGAAPGLPAGPAPGPAAREDLLSAIEESGYR